MKKIVIFLIVILLFGCASQQREHWKSETIHKIETTQLPAWVYELPTEGDFIIGISRKSFEFDKMKDSAKQMAAVVKSRNTASYSIDKFASLTTEEILREGKAVFKLNVSASPEETKRIYESLQLVDETFLHDFYIALFSEMKTGIPTSYRKKYVSNFPQWYEGDKIVVESNKIISYVHSSSSNLVSAWENAAENARLEIAKYLEKEVQSALISKDEEIKKSIALETRKKLLKMKITRGYISSELRDNLRSYKVYLELVMIK
ncbi:MAG: hypothetical protein KAW88_03145 [Candidatus Cloacimonetes bacterium]|nr:hypothetical protein [Candidatus Cloacimonadota bacterium]